MAGRDAARLWCQRHHQEGRRLHHRPGLLGMRLRCHSGMAVYAVGMLCALLAAAIFLLLATLAAMPVSTTHAIVAGVVGMTMVGSADMDGIGCLNWVKTPPERRPTELASHPTTAHSMLCALAHRRGREASPQS